MSAIPPDELEIQDYIDGRLEENRQEAVERYLEENLIQATQVQGVRERDALLRVAAQPTLNEPVPEKFLAMIEMARSLANGDAATTHDEDPPKPRATAAQVTARWSLGRMGMAGAVMAMTLVLGVALGWNGARLAGPSDEETASIVSEALMAYSYYSQEKEYSVEFDTSRAANWNSYMKRVFSTEIPPPDISNLGYSYLGARMLPGAQAKMAFYLFENEAGERLSVFFWQSGDPKAGRPAVKPIPENVFTKEWSANGFDFALLAPGGPKYAEGDEGVLSEVQKFYTNHFANILSSD